MDSLLNSEPDSPAGRPSFGAQSQPFGEVVDRMAAGKAEDAARLIEKLPEQVVELAPFIDEDTVDELIESRIATGGDPGEVEELFPYASKKKIGNLLARMVEGSLGDEWLSELAPFLNRRALNELVRQKMSGEKVDNAPSQLHPPTPTA